MKTIAMYGDLNCQELSAEESRMLTGGLHPFLVAGAAITVGIALFNAAEDAGEKIGKAIYHATH
jgi:hypothetical protein